MQWSAFLVYGPSVSEGFYDSQHYLIPKESEALDAYLKKVAQLDVNGTKIVPSNFNIETVIEQWRQIKKKSFLLIYTLNWIPFGLALTLFSSFRLTGIISIILSITTAYFGYYRSIQAASQVKLWMETQTFIREIDETLVYLFEYHVKLSKIQTLPDDLQHKIQAYLERKNGGIAL